MQLRLILHKVGNRNKLKVLKLVSIGLVVFQHLKNTVTRMEGGEGVSDSYSFCYFCMYT